MTAAPNKIIVGGSCSWGNLPVLHAQKLHSQALLFMSEALHLAKPVVLTWELLYDIKCGHLCRGLSGWLLGVTTQKWLKSC